MERIVPSSARPGFWALCDHNPKIALPQTAKCETKRGYAECLRDLVEERYKDAERIYLVQDNLNTHTAGALYATFPPAQARHILDCLEVHYTPKHGSWLNQAEIEISIFERGCLARPVGDQATLE